MKRILALLTAAAALTAQESPTIRVGTTIIIAPTTVTRSDGSFVNGLEAKDFQLYDNGKLQQINQDISFIPISLVVAIQKSASTEQVLPSLQKMGSMLEALVLGEQGEAAIVTFDHRIETVAEFTNDGKKFQEALLKLRPGSTSSRMTDAMMHSVRLLKSRPANRRRVVLLISETKDNGSELRLREVLREVEFANVMVYPVNMSRWINKLMTPAQPPRPSPVPVSARPLPPGAPQTPNTAMQMGYGGTFGSVFPILQEIFTATKAIFVDNPQEVYSKYTGTSEQSFIGLKGLEQAVARIGEELHSQYLLSYSPNNKEEGGFHQIQVAVRRDGLKVRTRAGYWMAASN